MSSSASQQVRPVIECLCQILSSYGFSPVTPEVFRLAKFDRDEATIPLWRCLFEMINFDSAADTQRSSSERFNQTPKDELVDTIKSDVFTRGYASEQFLALDSQMQHGSQQLLLCIGWLLYHMKLVEQCMRQCLTANSELDCDDTSALHQRQLQEKIASSPQEKELVGQVKQAMRLNSKLRFGLRRLHGLVVENAQLHHQIHQSHRMSSLEAYLCQHPHLLTHYTIDLENEHRRLNLLLFWNEHECIFWQWMESVLDQTTHVDVDDTLYEPLSQADGRRLEVEKSNFHAAIDTLDSALRRLEQLWISNETDRTSIERDMSLIDTQVSSLFSELLATNSSPTNKSPSDRSLFLHQPSRLIFAKPTDDSRSIKSSDLEREAARLARLQADIDQQIEKQRMILDRLSHQFENVMIV